MAPKSFGTAVSHILSCVPYGNSFGNFTIETPGLASNSFSAGHGGTGKKSKLWGKEGPSAVAIRMPRAWQVHSGPQGFPLKANMRSWFSLPFLQTESLSCLVYSQSGCPVDPRSSMVCENLASPADCFSLTEDSVLHLAFLSVFFWHTQPFFHSPAGKQPKVPCTLRENEVVFCHQQITTRTRVTK